MSGFTVDVCFSLAFFSNKDGEVVSKANKQIRQCKRMQVQYQLGLPSSRPE